MQIMLRWEKNSVGLWQTSRWSRYVWLGRSTYFERQDEASVTRVGDHWKMQAFVCHMEDKDKTYVNDLLSDDKNRMSENAMSAITSLSLKIRTLRDIRWKTMLAPERVKSEAGIIFSTQRWGARTPWPPPPPLGSATVIWLCHSLLKPISKCNPCNNLSYRWLIWPCVKYHIANWKGKYNSRVYVTPQWYTTDIGFLPPLPGF